VSGWEVRCQTGPSKALDVVASHVTERRPEKSGGYSTCLRVTTGLPSADIGSTLGGENAKAKAIEPERSFVLQVEQIADAAKFP
jgi:hypothetical protein